MERRISVMFVLPNLHTGGAERVVTTISNHLPREEFESSILLFRKEGGYLEFLKDDVEIIDIQTSSIRASLFPVLKMIWKRKPDIVFSGWGEISAFLSPFIPLFRCTRFISRETNVVSQHVTRKEILFFYRFYNNFHQIITQSDDMTQDLLDNFRIKEEKIFKINNPVDFEFINEKLVISKRPNTFDEAYKNVVAIGNLSVRKGFDNLLQVFVHLKEKKIKLHILGDGKDREFLYQMKTGLGLENVIFHGQQKNPYEFLKFADLFILSSRYEGLPNVLLEAGACGVYALVNNCPGGINEIVQSGVNGEIQDITRYADFAEKIKLALQREIDKEKIISFIRSKFSKEIILKKYREILLKQI